MKNLPEIREKETGIRERDEGIAPARAAAGKPEGRPAGRLPGRIPTPKNLSRLRSPGERALLPAAGEPGPEAGPRRTAKRAGRKAGTALFWAGGAAAAAFCALFVVFTAALAPLTSPGEAGAEPEEEPAGDPFPELYRQAIHRMRVRIAYSMKQIGAEGDFLYPESTVEPFRICWALCRVLTLSSRRDDALKILPDLLDARTVLHFTRRTEADGFPYLTLSLSFPFGEELLPALGITDPGLRKVFASLLESDADPLFERDTIGEDPDCILSDPFSEEEVNGWARYAAFLDLWEKNMHVTTKKSGRAGKEGSR